MAQSVQNKFGATFGVSTTGYAGPGGGTEKDPVGTVYIAIAHHGKVKSERISAPQGSTRDEVRCYAAARVLELLLEESAINI